MADWKTDADWNVGDAMKKQILDDIFGNTICNGERIKLIKEMNTNQYFSVSAATYGILDVCSEFWENGSRLIGGNKLRWEIVYKTDSGSGDCFVTLYNVTDAGYVTGSEVTLPQATTTTRIILPAAEANYFSLVDNEKEYRIYAKVTTATKLLYIYDLRLVAVMPAN